MAAKTGMLATMLVGTAGAGAVGDIMEGNQKKAMEDYNADVLKGQAHQETVAATEETARVQRRNERILAMQRNLLGSSGLANMGTVPTTLGDTASDLARGAADTYNRGVLQSSYYRSQSSIAKMRGEAAQTAGYINAGNDILGAATKAASAGGA
jgi:hypothetical protein